MSIAANGITIFEDDAIQDAVDRIGNFAMDVCNEIARRRFRHRSTLAPGEEELSEENAQALFVEVVRDLHVQAEEIYGHVLQPNEDQLRPFSHQRLLETDALS